MAFARGNVGKAKALASSEEFENVKNEALGLLKYLQDMEIPEIITAVKKVGEYKLEVNDFLDILAIWYLGRRYRLSGRWRAAAVMRASKM